MKRVLQLFLIAAFALYAIVAQAAVKTEGNFVTIDIENAQAGAARVVRLQVVNDNIVRVQATCEAQLPTKPACLIIVPQTARPKCTVTYNGDSYCVKAKNVTATVNKADGRIKFTDEGGKVLAAEAVGGKSFKPFKVPEREIGVGTLTDDQSKGLTWTLKFENQDEALYGLGQHQSGELNMKGKNEDLFQYNTKVSVPMVLSTNGYGILWDSYSYCRFGNPEDYLQLNRAFNLYDKHGKKGSLTGTYTDKNGQRLVRGEDSLYFEFDMPAGSELGKLTEPGGIKNLPKGFALNGATVV